MPWKILLGILVLFLGIPIGDILSKHTKEELKSGQKWFNLIIIVGLLAAIISAIAKNDFLFFSFLFIVIVTSRNLIDRKRKIKEKKTTSWRDKYF